MLRRDHGSLRYGSDAAEIRINAMALTGGQPDYYGFSVWCGTDQKYQCQQFASFIGISVIPIVCGFQGMTENNGKFTTLAAAAVILRLLQ